MSADTKQLLWNGWDWEASSVLIVILTPLAVLWLGRGAGLRAKPWPLALAAGMLILALLSPLSTLARSYLFSAHMLQHLLLVLVVPALLLLSMPAQPPASRYQPAPPLLAWPAGVGAMALWHTPSLCNAAAANPWIYRLQIVSLLCLGGLFWWPILGPDLRRRLPPLPGMIYLVSACFVCTLQGIYLTFSTVSVCASYLHPADSLGILPWLRTAWGLSQAVDQQIGGLMMWVPPCVIYLSGVLLLLARWYSNHEEAVAYG